jgi:hypothetical protein
MIEASSSANRFKESDNLMLITTMGVKLTDLRNGEKLQAIAPVVSQIEEEQAQSAEPAAQKS